MSMVRPRYVKLCLQEIILQREMMRKEDDRVIGSTHREMTRKRLGQRLSHELLVARNSTDRL